MQFDALLNLSTAQAVTVTAASSVYDVTGAGSGNAPNMIGGLSSTGATLVIGDDIGAGDGFAIPEIFWNVPTAFTGTVNGSTLTIQLQAAPDNGSYSPGTYVTLLQTEPFSTTILTAGASGQFQIPPVPPGFGLAAPRFYRLNYSVSGSFTTGLITANIVINPSQPTKLQNYPSNYTA